MTMRLARTHLRSVLLWSPDRGELFDALFARFWGGWAEDLIRESSTPSPDYASEGQIEAAAGQGVYSPMEVLLQKERYEALFQDQDWPA